MWLTRLPMSDPIKFVLTGDIATGKTSIIRRFSEGTYEEDAAPTMCDFMDKTLTVNGKEFCIQIWDTAGQERFRTVTSSFYKGAKVVAFVFDVAKKETFSNLQHWITEVDRCAAETAEKVLIGNKIDLSPREVTREEAEAHAEELGIDYFEVSAKDGTNINECFTTIVESIADYQPAPKSLSTVRPQRPTPQQKKKSACVLL